MPIVPVTNTIVEMIAIIEISEFDLANRKPESVANVVRGSPARSRTVGHHDSHELNESRAPGELDEFIPTVCVIYISLREWLPVVVIVRVQMHRIVSRPVFDPELPRVRGAPVNSGSNTGRETIRCICTRTMTTTGDRKSTRLNSSHRCI